MDAFPAGAEDDSFSFCPKDDRLTNKDAGDGKQFYFFSPARFACSAPH
jgi:hypothetical protein